MAVPEIEKNPGPVRAPEFLHSIVGSLYGRTFAVRRTLQLGIDLALVFLTVVLGGFLRIGFDFETFGILAFVLLGVMAVVVHAGFGRLLGLYRRRYPYASHAEVLVLGVAAGLGTAFLSVLNAVMGRLTPVSTPILGMALSLLAMFFVRSAWRFAFESWKRPSEATATAVIVYGAGRGGQRAVELMLNDPESPFVPVGFVDDDPDLRQFRVRGCRVMGTSHDLEAIREQSGVSEVVLAMPTASNAEFRGAVDRAKSQGFRVQVFPTTTELFAGPASTADIRPVTEADLLGRGRIDTDIASISGYLTGQRVLVTGAGGSIGSELCRQIHEFAPAELIMLDRDESALHAVQLSIDGRGLLSTRNLVVCNIRDAEALEKVFLEHEPQVVFHAAALKHVPLLEMYPAEGFKTNVLGSRNLLQLAARYGVDRFVNISTDKAADPENVLGYTKRIAERLCAAQARDANGTFLSVRFGNVLGSRGSVLTAFRAQIDAGGPVTVTHPDVSRYFMTVQEAVQLVIQAGAVGRDGEALILDMGKPIRIAEVAQRLVDEADADIEVVYTGLRPGEKMHEVLMGAGEVDERPVHPLISHVSVDPLTNDVLESLIAREGVDIDLTESWLDITNTDTVAWLR